MQSTSQIYGKRLNDEFVLDELDTLWTKSSNIVLELVYFKDFNEVVFDEINPRHIIDYMQQRHRLNADAINNQPDLLETIIYRYTSKKDKKKCKLKFSNNMSFRDDIFLICYLHQIITLNESSKEMNVVHAIFKLIVEKYRLNDSYMAMNLNYGNFTLSDISYSFPSISLDMFNNNIGDIFQATTSMFPNINLPKMILIRPVAICKILPKLSNPPIAILIAIFLKIIDSSTTNSLAKQVPLATVYSFFLKNYNSTHFPDSLKIFLCKRWDIVTMVDDNYHFNNSFMLYYNQAKDIIRELRESERSKDISGFEDILSKL